MARRQHRINPERLNFDAIISYQAQTERPGALEDGLDMIRIAKEATRLVVLSVSAVAIVAGIAVVR